MARPVWRGTLSFGLVNVPVRLYTATEDHSPRFNQFQRGTADRVRYRRVNERTGDEVGYDEIVKGAEVAGGDYVIIEPEELDAIAPGRSRSIEVERFVAAGEIDPAQYQKTYYLAPENDEAKKAYALLRDAMAAADRIAVATFVMRGRQYLAAVRPGRVALVLQTMFFADEVRDPEDELDHLPGTGRPPERELDQAEKLITSMTEAWRPEDFSDTYREKVDELVASKRRGEEVVSEGEPPESTNVVDLMDALRESVARARGDSGGTDGGAENLDGMTKKDLAALAADLGVRGRSSMTRDELVKAVRKERRTGKRKRAS